MAKFGFGNFEVSKILKVSLFNLLPWSNPVVQEADATFSSWIGLVESMACETAWRTEKSSIHIYARHCRLASVAEFGSGWCWAASCPLWWSCSLFGNGDFVWKFWRLSLWEFSLFVTLYLIVKNQTGHVFKWQNQKQKPSFSFEIKSLKPINRMNHFRLS